MSTIRNQWKKGVGESMKYETPIMEMITLEKSDIITVSVGGSGSGTVVRPPFPTATSADWD